MAESVDESRFSTGVGVAESGSEAAREAAHAALDRLGADRADFCQVFCSSTYDPETVLAALRDEIGTETPLLGCTSGGEFSGDRVVDGGVAVALVRSDRLSVYTGIGTGLADDVDRAVREAVTALPETVDGYPHRSALALHDGLTDVGERLAFALQRKLGSNVPLAGGAASDGHAFDETLVFCDGRIHRDAVGVALIASTDRPILAVDHGHEPISGPLEVTDASGNVVRELNGRPAIDVWREAIRERAAASLDVAGSEIGGDPSELEPLVGEFEFGIDQGGAYKMRWPRTKLEDGAIRFAVDIPEGTVLRVMRGSPENQLESVRNAASAVVERAGDREIAGAFVYDCASRKIVLGDRFVDAIAGIDDALGAPFAGFETYGELHMRKGEMSGFHNTTTVVMALLA